MPIETIISIAFWGTCSVIATLAVLDIARTLLVVGLTKLEKHFQKKVDDERTTEEKAADWIRHQEFLKLPIQYDLFPRGNNTGPWDM